MRTGPGSDVHLTYCTNIHPGETWPEVRRIVERARRRRQETGRPRRDRSASGSDSRPSPRKALASARERSTTSARCSTSQRTLRVHDQRVSLRQLSRRRASRKRSTAPIGRSRRGSLTRTRWPICWPSCVPRDMEGSISTAPLGFAPRMRDAASEERATRAMLEHARHLHRLARANGSVDRTRARARARLPRSRPRPTPSSSSSGACSRARRSRGRRKRSDARSASRGIAPPSPRTLPRHLPRGRRVRRCRSRAWSAVERAGLRILKVQLTAGLRLVAPDDRVDGRRPRVRRRRLSPPGRRMPRRDAGSLPRSARRPRRRPIERRHGRRVARPLSRAAAFRSARSARRHPRLRRGPAGSTPATRP